MKTILALILCCGSVFAVDTNDIRVVSTVKTNVHSDSVTTTDVYTRDGQTNLVRDTKTKAGALQIRIHRFYHAGLLLGDFLAMPDSSGFTIEANSPYAVSFEFSQSKDARSAVVGTKDGVILDRFNCTNGIFYPVESSFIIKANSFFNTPPEGSGRDLEQSNEKHKDR